MPPPPAVLSPGRPAYATPGHGTQVRRAPVGVARQTPGSEPAVCRSFPLSNHPFPRPFPQAGGAAALRTSANSGPTSLGQSLIPLVNKLQDIFVQVGRKRAGDGGKGEVRRQRTWKRGGGRQTPGRLGAKCPGRAGDAADPSRRPRAREGRRVRPGAAASPVPLPSPR